MTDTKFDAHYPMTLKLGGKSIELQLMSAQDRDPIIAFVRSLPAGDLLFLRVDLTQQAAIDEWIAQLESGHSAAIVAYANRRMLGYASVHRDALAHWTRRVGEIRVNIASDCRGIGLGKALVGHIFGLASSLSLRKLVAHMTVDQPGARAAFKHFGFVQEALLTNYVEDRQGNPHDLIIMSHDMEQS
jgi:L-amino acid N-acyltransferase YncA